MNGSHFDKQTQRERTCSLVHGTWRCVGAKIACAGACALMVGQLLLPNVALATEYADPAAATGEVATAPVTPTVVEDTAAPATAPATDAAPAAQATAEPQQTAPTGATDESNDAEPAEQNTPSDNAATPANDAIMPCGVTDVVGGSGVRVNITVRNNYTDIKNEETIEYVKGIALVDGDQSALDGSALTFIGLGDLIVHAAYDSASNKTTLTLDISKIQRQKEEQKYFTEYKENKSKMTTTYDGSKLTYTGTEPGNIIIGDPDDAFKGDTEATGNPLLTRSGMTTTPAPMSTRGRALLSRQRNQNRNPSPLPMFRIRTSIGSWILVRRRRQVSLTTMQINTKSLMNAGRNLKTTNPLLPGIPITAHMVPCRLLQSLKAGKSTCILLC